MFIIEGENVISFEFFAFSKDFKETAYIGKFEYVVSNKKLLEEYLLGLTSKDYSSQSCDKGKIALLLARAVKQSVKTVSKLKNLMDLIHNNYDAIGDLIRKDVNSKILLAMGIEVLKLDISSIETSDNEIAKYNRKRRRIAKIYENNR